MHALWCLYTTRPTLFHDGRALRYVVLNPDSSTERSSKENRSKENLFANDLKSIDEE